MEHYLICEAPICADDRTLDWEKNVTWFPGELVCGKKPPRLFQKRQNKINRWLKKEQLKYPERSFTAFTLEKPKALYRGIKGNDPNQTPKPL